MNHCDTKNMVSRSFLLYSEWHPVQGVPVYRTASSCISFACFATVAALAQNPVYSYRVQKTKASATILAISTSAHAGSSAQEIYLAKIANRQHADQTVKLVDAYPADARPILRTLLTERSRFHMVLVRNPECDTTGSKFFLGPSEANIFEDSVRVALKAHAAELIPCFMVLHDATRLQK